MKTVLLVSLILSIILTGCATKPLERVEIPIAVACHAEPVNKPTLRYSPPYTSLFEAIRDLLGDRVVSASYEGELEAAIKGCN